jgi:hypothetical protein
MIFFHKTMKKKVEQVLKYGALFRKLSKIEYGIHLAWCGVVVTGERAISRPAPPPYWCCEHLYI